MAQAKRGHIDFRGISPVAALEGTAGTLLQTAAQTTTGADGTHDVYHIGKHIVTIYHGLGAGVTSWIANGTANGWGLPFDAADNCGAIMTVGSGLAGANSRYCFTVGTDPAFFMRWTGICADVTQADLVAASAYFAGGFRTAGAYSASNAIAEFDTQAEMVSDANATPFADVAMLSCAFTADADVYSLFKTNSTAGTATDTSLGEADGVAWTYEIRVSAAGIVTGYRNGTILSTPASGVLGTLTNGVVVQPSVVFCNGTNATTASTAIVTSLTWGYQN